MIKIFRTMDGEIQHVNEAQEDVYKRQIERYLEKRISFVTCIFGDLQENKVVVKGTKAKMARGEMVRFLAENKIEDPKEMKNFERLG